MSYIWGKTFNFKEATLFSSRLKSLFFNRVAYWLRSHWSEKIFQKMLNLAFDVIIIHIDQGHWWVCSVICTQIVYYCIFSIFCLMCSVPAKPLFKSTSFGGARGYYFNTVFPCCSPKTQYDRSNMCTSVTYWIGLTLFYWN